MPIVRMVTIEVFKMVAWYARLTYKIVRLAFILAHVLVLPLGLVLYLMAIPSDSSLDVRSATMLLVFLGFLDIAHERVAALVWHVVKKELL